uniref:Replication factor C subunit 1 n=1 Tax=Rousettus aegyptiacus TaxID=9407 RepID=A0A7J8EAC6_ROUAE|nr:replication factor C subunit 1 [Rousettus aegyptiacus]
MSARKQTTLSWVVIADSPRVIRQQLWGQKLLMKMAYWI